MIVQKKVKRHMSGEVLRSGPGLREEGPCDVGRLGREKNA